MTSFGAAWIALSIAFGFHVIDEAATNFLDWHNSWLLVATLESV